jgi:hypothetical protein
MGNIVCGRYKLDKTKRRGKRRREREWWWEWESGGGNRRAPENARALG